MLFTAAKYLIVVVSAAWAGPAAAGHAIVADPVLGLKYDTGRITFEPLPAGILKLCPMLVTPAWTRESWIYARVTKGLDDYLIIGGRFASRRAKPPGERYEPDVRGGVIHIRGDDCSLAGPADEFFEPEATDGPIDRDTVAGLARNLKERYALAFGEHDLKTLARTFAKPLKGARTDVIVDNIERLAR